MDGAKGAERASEPKDLTVSICVSEPKTMESTNMFERTMRAFMRLDPAVWIPPVILMLTWLVLAWVLFAFLWPLDPMLPMPPLGRM